MKQQASAEATCGSCEEVSVLEAYCHDCSSSICANCVDSHKKLKPLKRHKVVSLQSVRSSQRSITWKLSYCSRHDGETVRFYCFGCSSLICSECIKYHKKHKWEPLDVAAEAEKAEIKCLLPQMDDSISPITEAIQEVSSVIEDVAVNKDRLNKRITELFDKIAKVVAKRRQELLEEVDKSSLAKTTQLDIQKEGLEKIKNSLQLAIDTMTAACSEYDSVELLSVKYHVQHAAKECLEESNAVERSPVCASNLTFVADEKILETLSEFAEVEESISTTFDDDDDGLSDLSAPGDDKEQLSQIDFDEKSLPSSPPSSPKEDRGTEFMYTDEYQFKSQEEVMLPSSSMEAESQEGILQSLSPEAESQEGILQSLSPEAESQEGIPLQSLSPEAESQEGILRSSSPEAESQEESMMVYSQEEGILPSSSPKTILCDQYPHKSQEKDLPFPLIEQSLSSVLRNFSTMHPSSVQPIKSKPASAIHTIRPKPASTIRIIKSKPPTMDRVTDPPIVPEKDSLIHPKQRRRQRNKPIPVTKGRGVPLYWGPNWPRNFS